MANFDRIERLKARRLDALKKVGELNEVYKRIKDEPAIQYAVGAMQPIDPEYTNNTYKESERIQEQLSQPLLDKNIEVEYQYQGSVTNDTHIKAHSDIDTLIIHQRFSTIEPPNRPENPYKGNPILDLIELRRYCVEIVQQKFPKVNIDDSGSKSVSLSGGSLNREIDLVFCNWWDTYEYYLHKQKYLRGIAVLNKDKSERIFNKPFLHNERIDQQDRKVKGNLRKCIRLLKSLSYDAEEKNALSSYDLASIMYHMPEAMMNYDHGQELQLIQSCDQYLRNMLNNEQKCYSIDVPNGTRKVFCPEGASINQLRVTIKLLQELLSDIEKGLTKSFRKLADARIGY